jgi:ABC-type transport system substrate-binding protein
VSNSNFSLLDDKGINEAMAKAEVVNDPAERNQAWGDIDKQITQLAPSIPWLWDTQPNLHSSNVNGVINKANASWDFSFTSIK